MTMLPATVRAQSLAERVDRLERQLDAQGDYAGDVKWHLAGYASAGAVASDAPGAIDHFTVGSFNPVFHFQYKDILLFEAELEIEVNEEGETEMELEYSQLDLLVADSLVIVIGKFLSPVGQFQERLHPAWINKMPNPPPGWGHGGAQPLNDVGVQFRGGVSLGESMFTYALAVSNGPRAGHHGPELEGFNGDNNDNKAVAGRLAFLPNQGFEIGISFMNAIIPGAEPEPPGNPESATEGDYSLVGADFAFTPGPWDVRVEYLTSELTAHKGQLMHGDTFVSDIPLTTWDAWYVQFAYRLPGQGFWGNLEPVVRVGELDIKGNEPWIEDSEEQTAFGINYILVPAAVIKFAVEQRTFTAPEPDEEENRYLLQVAYGF